MGSRSRKAFMHGAMLRPTTPCFFRAVRQVASTWLDAKNSLEQFTTSTSCMSGIRTRYNGAGQRKIKASVRQKTDTLPWTCWSTLPRQHLESKQCSGLLQTRRRQSGVLIHPLWWKQSFGGTVTLCQCMGMCLCVTRRDQMFMRPPTPPDAKASPSGLKARVFTGVMWPFSRKTQAAPTSDHREDYNTAIKKFLNFFFSAKSDSGCISPIKQSSFYQMLFTTWGKVGSMSCSMVQWLRFGLGFEPRSTRQLLQPKGYKSIKGKESKLQKLVHLKITLFTYLFNFYLCIYETKFGLTAKTLQQF